MPHAPTLARLIAGLALAGLLGCGPTARQADPATARATLRRALDAWQKGDSLDAFQRTSSLASIAEPEWQRGTRLLRYDLREEAEPSGFDLRFAARLTLQDRAGRKYLANAVYDVSTAPALVVIRSEESR
jgi:hypothetical protein